MTDYKDLSGTIKLILKNNLVGVRNDGTPLWKHSWRMYKNGLKYSNTNDINLLLGIAFHDFFEDLCDSRSESIIKTIGILHTLNSLYNFNLNAVINLIDKCSYKEELYKLPFEMRKLFQCEIWINSDYYIKFIKFLDVYDNLTHNPTERYKNWAYKFYVVLFDYIKKSNCFSAEDLEKFENLLK